MGLAARRPRLFFLYEKELGRHRLNHKGKAVRTLLNPGKQLFRIGIQEGRDFHGTRKQRQRGL